MAEPAADGGRSLLTGRVVVLTRPAHQTDDAVAALDAVGAEVLAAPVIGIVDPSDGGLALAEALGRLASYAWVVVTSANAADRVADGLAAVPAVRVAAVGPRTAARLRAAGVRVDLVPEHFTAVGLGDAFPTAPDGGGSVLFPASAGARQTVPAALAALGWRVDVVEAYRTAPVVPPADRMAAAAAADAVVFASPSAVEAYTTAQGGRARPELAACIGPVTAAAAAAAGFRVVEASPHTMAGVVAALVAVLGGEGPEPAR